jgi:hypothetical protein
MQIQREFINVIPDKNIDNFNKNDGRNAKFNMINMNINVVDSTCKRQCLNKNSKKTRVPRNRGGCLCCRKRKIKCDETKPSCLKCDRGSFLCCWPENGNESLSHNSEFKLTKLEKNNKFINMNPKFKLNDQQDKQIEYDEIDEDIKNIDEDALIRQYIRETTKDIIPKQIQFFAVNMSETDIIFFDAFINGFIVSISNQLAHKNLLPGTVIIPMGFFDPLIMKLCITCGASYLNQCENMNYLIDNKIQQTISNSNKIVIKELINRLDNRPIMESREWILIYFILRNARQKFIYEGRNAQTINLISGIQAIKLWIETKKRQFNNSKTEKIIPIDEANKNIKTDGDVYKIGKYETRQNDETESYILLDKLVDKTNILKIDNNYISDINIKSNYTNKNSLLIDMLDIESRSLISSLDSNNDDINNNTNDYLNEISPFERTLLDTFIFNYSGTLLTIDKSLLNCIPSPFEVFDLLAPLLSKPIYNCVVPWMNNPTAGAALPMIELQAKIIWLSFSPNLNDKEIKIVKNIQKIVKFYTRPIITEDIWKIYPKSISKKLLESCLISEIIAKGIYLFSMKILNKLLNEYDNDVQNIVNSMFKILDCISYHSQTSVIAKWAFLVIGSAIVNFEQQQTFKKRLLGFIDALKTGSLRTTLAALEKIWHDKIGLDALFIEEYLDLIVI